jgi:Tat protein secretion system quality control protein TatD with DNase activity
VIELFRPIPASCAVGIHPNDAAEATTRMVLIVDLIAQPGVVAIGEPGDR